mgnify:CR=1 FL=1
MQVAGYNIIVHDGPIGHVQFRFPRTKRRRIRRKWAKRQANLRPVFLGQPLLDQTNRRIICTSRMAAMLRRELTSLMQGNLS